MFAELTSRKYEKFFASEGDGYFAGILADRLGALGSIRAGSSIPSELAEWFSNYFRQRPSTGVTDYTALTPGHVLARWAADNDLRIDNMNAWLVPAFESLFKGEPENVLAIPNEHFLTNALIWTRQCPDPATWNRPLLLLKDTIAETQPQWSAHLDSLFASALAHNQIDNSLRDHWLTLLNPETAKDYPFEAIPDEDFRGILHMPAKAPGSEDDCGAAIDWLAIALGLKHLFDRLPEKLRSPRGPMRKYYERVGQVTGFSEAPLCEQLIVHADDAGWSNAQVLTLPRLFIILPGCDHWYLPAAAKIQFNESETLKPAMLAANQVARYHRTVLARLAAPHVENAVRPLTFRIIHRLLRMLGFSRQTPDAKHFIEFMRHCEVARMKDKLPLRPERAQAILDTVRRSKMKAREDQEVYRKAIDEHALELLSY